MITKILFSLILLAAVSFAGGASIQLNELGKLKVGGSLPDFAGFDLSLAGSEPVSLSDLMGWVKKTGPQSHPVIVFFSTSCLPCRVGLFALRDHPAELEAAQVQVILVAVGDERTKLRRFLKEHRLSFHVVDDPDGKMAVRYGVMGKGGAVSDARLPVTVLADFSGTITAIVTEEGNDYLDLVLAGHP
jgi:peroxiredoxin